jgi:hypothetical protein
VQTTPGQNEHRLCIATSGGFVKEGENKKGDRYEVEPAMQDRSGETIGAIGIVFNYQKGREAKYQKNAERISRRNKREGAHHRETLQTGKLGLPMLLL